MTLDANDPRLTAYALGELDAEEARQLEQELADSPELELVVEEIRQASAMLSESLASEPRLSLTEEQREAIIAEAENVDAADVDVADIDVAKSGSPALPSTNLSTSDAAPSSLPPLRSSVKVLAALAATLLLIGLAAPLLREQYTENIDVARTFSSEESGSESDPIAARAKRQITLGPLDQDWNGPDPNNPWLDIMPSPSTASEDSSDIRRAEVTTSGFGGGGFGGGGPGGAGFGGGFGGDGSFGGLIPGGFEGFDPVGGDADEGRDYDYYENAEFFGQTGDPATGNGNPAGTRVIQRMNRLSTSGVEWGGWVEAGDGVPVESSTTPRIIIQKEVELRISLRDSRKSLLEGAGASMNRIQGPLDPIADETTARHDLRIEDTEREGNETTVQLPEFAFTDQDSSQTSAEGQKSTGGRTGGRGGQTQAQADVSASRNGRVVTQEQLNAWMRAQDEKNAGLRFHLSNETASGVPRTEDIVYPPRTITKATAGNRDHYVSVDLTKPTEAQKKIQAALETEIDASALRGEEKLSLADVAEFFGDGADISIVIDQESLDELGIAADSPLLGAVVAPEDKDKPLGKKLKSILDKVDPELTFMIKDDALLITTKEKESESLITKVNPGDSLLLDQVLRAAEAQRQAQLQQQKKKQRAERITAIEKELKALNQQRELVEKSLEPEKEELRDQYVALLKLRRKLEAEHRQLTGRVTTWRRARATPNASRLMIGENEELPLEGMQANVQIDGFRARVLLDYYYYNDRDRQYEGNFKLRLPNEASLYFFAFGETAYEYRPQLESDERGVGGAFFNLNDARGGGNTPEEILRLRAGSWNAPKVARIVPKEKAAHAYRETVRRRVDPALVEWSGAGIFAARVFPLAPQKLHRIVVGYDVDLTRVGDHLQYTLDLPEDMLESAVDINLSATAGGSATVQPAVKPFMSNGRAYYNISKSVARRVTVQIKDVGNTIIAGRDKELDSPLFAASLVADLPTEKVDVSSPQAVFLLDTSLSSNPDKFNVYLKLLEATLEKNRDSLQQFAVLLFNVENHWWQPKFVDNTPENVEQLMAYAHTLSLEGATDLGAALAQAARPDWFVSAGQVRPWDLFLLSDGALNWGQANLHQVTRPLTAEGSHAGALFAYNTKMAGTASRVLQHLARETGGSVFSVVREAEIDQVAIAHRQRPWKLLGVEIEGGSDLLLAGRPSAVYPGQPLLLVGRGEPTSDKPVVLKLQRGEELKTLRLDVVQRLHATLAARTYGQVAVGQMESLGSATEDVSVAYARHFRVTGRTCSLLMLESEADYKRFNIKPEDDAFVVKSSQASRVVAEALQKAAKLLANPKAAFQAQLAKLEDMPGATFKVSPALKIAVDSLEPTAFDVPSGQLRCQHHTWEGLPTNLKEQLSTGKLDYDLVHQDAQRRMSKYSAADALRAVSSLIENSPGNLALVRDIAYSAMVWDLHDQAYHLLHRVAQARPYEPQMYLAMAQSLASAGHNDLALLHYEIASTGSWDERFRQFNHIVNVDYVHFLRQVQRGERKLTLAEFAEARLDRLAPSVKLESADIVVAIMWNTDGTDVDLHVTEPTGELCNYQNRQTKIGGSLTRDCTQGFGPELYVLPTARAGKYDVQAKYYSSDANRASTRTKVIATIYEGWGTDHERATRKTIALTTGKEMHPVAKLGVEEKKKE